ncbi:hypothetical protein EDD30_7571 [Couchioplanes caeruleus]|uniref:Uncharacterized protein n=3 Tax=Couchioplanes caeruleus TaxID=56438 RepID=A0A1K0FHN7_9ACTN|nr:hypothetical protein BG844_21210 [Couchioplanes caeruleus subsp. caeruleus]ROP34478.1 hypothetical protein EDD30_7571 [Couchioplanes caeruleus]
MVGGLGIGALAGMLTSLVFLGTAGLMEVPPGDRLKTFIQLPLVLPIGLTFGIGCGLIGGLASAVVIAAFAPWWVWPGWPARLAGAVICAAPVLVASRIGTVLAPHMGSWWPHPLMAIPAAIGAAAGGAWLGPWLLSGSAAKVTHHGRYWGAAAAAMLLVAVLPGDTLAFGPGQRIEVVAGAGTGTGTSAADAAIRGRLVGLAMDDTAALRVLTRQGIDYTLWTVRDGQLSRVAVPDLHGTAVSGLATGPGGSVYISGAGGVLRIEPDGRTVRRFKVDQATYREPQTPAAAGAPTEKTYTPSLDGVTVSADDRLSVVEGRFDRSSFHLVRTVSDGKVRTVLGREPDGHSASLNKGFADGIRGTDLALDSTTPVPLATAPDGGLYAAVAGRGVVRVKPDGTAHAVIGDFAGDHGTEPEAEWQGPWKDRGPAARMPIVIRGNSEPYRGADNASLVTAANGDLYLTNGWIGKDRRLPDSFEWEGAANDTQQAVLDEARRDRWKQAEEEVLRVTPDGRVATVAGYADMIAVHGDWLYLAQGFLDERDAERVVIVRTAIPK